jgi:hypothetical protein
MPVTPSRLLPGRVRRTGDDVLNPDGPDGSVRPVMMGSQFDDAMPTAAL